MLCILIFLLLLIIDKAFTPGHHHHQIIENKNGDLKMGIINKIEQDIPYATQSSSQFLPQLILLFALSIHAVFEGLAIGVSIDRLSCYQLIIAVSCHKWAEALAMVYNYLGY